MIYSVSNYMSNQSNRVTGLMSGLDTDEIVKGLTLGTQNKITSCLQNKQLLSWKSDAVRAITNKLVSFSDKYFSYSSPTNLLSSSFYSQSKIAATGDFKDLITLSGSSDIAKKLTITGINSIASNAKLTGKDNVASQTISSGQISVDQLMNGKTTNNLAGETITIKVDGKDDVEITFPKDFNSTDSNVIADEINKQLQDNGIDAKVTIEANDSGKDVFKFTAGATKVSISGKALDVLGIKAGDVGAGNTVQSKEIEGLKFETTSTLKDQTISFKFNNTTKSITLGEYTTVEELKKDIQDQLDKNFGSGKIQVGLSADNKLEITTNSEVDTLAITGTSKSVSEVLGLESGMANRINMNSTIDKLNFNSGSAISGEQKLTINGVDITIDTSKDTISDMMRKINSSDAGVTISYSNSTNKFSIVSKETGVQAKIDIADTDLANTLGISNSTNESYSQGKDTEITVNYNGEDLTFTSDTSSVNIDGLVIGLTDDALKKANELKDPATGKIEIGFSSSPNNDKIVETVKEFINDYNEILELVAKEATVPKTSAEKQYKPLTEEQRAEMTESQIEEWEKTAKKGLLYGSSELTSLMTDLRTAITTALPLDGLSSELGISTSKNWTDNGKIVFDEDKFNKALTENPDRVIDMLTKGYDESLTPGTAEYNKSAGIMTRMKATVDKYASTVGKKGVLVEMAGIENTSTAANNSIAKKMKDIDGMLDKLKIKLKTEQDRYYAQYTRLETYISKMDAQSSWLYQQMST